jgi:hypothetical protein
MVSGGRRLVPKSPIAPLTLTRRSIAAAIMLILGVSTCLVFAGRAQADTSGNLVTLTNSARAAAGLPALTVSADLAAAARSQASRMAAQHRLSHTPNLAGAICCWAAIGENVGEGPTASAVHSAFMGSAEHRANILSGSYTQIGVGVVVDAAGTLWVSEIFRRPSGQVANPTPPPPAPPTTTRATSPKAQPKPSASSESPRPRPAVTHAPTPQADQADQQGRVSRDFSAGRPALAAQGFLTAITKWPAAPDPVSGLLVFAAATADTGA